MTDAVEALYAEIEKAGLIKPGKPPLMKRVAFLLGSNRNDRNYKIGRYLTGRKTGARMKRGQVRTGAYSGVYKMKLPALNLPRKYSRLPRVGRIKNPFKAGTSKIGGRVKRALAAHTAAFGLNQVPGKAVAAGALGHAAAGVHGAAAGFSAVEAGSIAASALLARSIARRGKAAKYLSRRGKRKTGIYKSGAERMDAIDELYSTIEKASGRGLLGPRGSRGALRSAAVRRSPKAAGYLAERLAGNAPHRATSWTASNPDGTKRRGTSAFKRHGIYKSIDDDAAIEKASVSFRGERMTTRGRRHVATHGDVFAGSGPAGRVSDKDRKGVLQRLKRAGANGPSGAGLNREKRVRGQRFQLMFGARKRK